MAASLTRRDWRDRRDALASAPATGDYRDDNWEWDEAKSAQTLKSRGVSFTAAARSLEAASAWPTFDVTRTTDGERRFRTVVRSASLPDLLLSVIWTWRDPRVRIISTRPASHLERQQYEQATT
jgi:uncharacterized DUF497 family protein